MGVYKIPTRYGVVGLLPRVIAQGVPVHTHMSICLGADFFALAWNHRHRGIFRPNVIFPRNDRNFYALKKDGVVDGGFYAIRKSNWAPRNSNSPHPT